MNSSNSIKTKDMAYIALCAVLLAVCSWISIPFTVPFTLQTFAVFCTLLILGGKRGTVAVAVYILMAAVGLPVLSGFRGGAGALLGTTGGYILGFILT
ncbi:MAG: biotin transporter BioY, partial [Firmicutes bacterium]|nr:biotin transporter BioY [Bacillota bacterium]